MQEFCGIKTREYFRKKILVPLIQMGTLLLTRLGIVERARQGVSEDE
jgi:hypothetical protein